MNLTRSQIDSALKAALREDIGAGDITTLALVSSGDMASARLIARKAGVAAGLQVFQRAFQMVDKRCKVRLLSRDGVSFKAGAVLAQLSGPARALLSAERVALNFTQRLCGIATLTAAYVAASRLAKRGSKTVILDTRKTTPGLRAFEKYAVLCGGGKNHRIGLYDAFLIKDNHIRACGSVAEAVRRAKKQAGAKIVEVEVENLRELREVLPEHPDIVLLDNMRGSLLKKAVALTTGSGVLTEVSGGVRLREVAGLARLGVDRISVGALTHSAPALDLSLEFI
ncbi:MAG: carboxylating nicotinate-nucleotide diphosphorylase [candidate division FCPU426 bacterium]